MIGVFLFLFFLLAQFLRTLNIVRQPGFLLMTLQWRERLTVLHYQQACGGVAGFDHELGLRKLGSALLVLESEMHARILVGGDFIVDSTTHDVGRSDVARIFSKPTRQANAIQQCRYYTTEVSPGVAHRELPILLEENHTPNVVSAQCPL